MHKKKNVLSSHLQNTILQCFRLYIRKGVCFFFWRYTSAMPQVQFIWLKCKKTSILLENWENIPLAQIWFESVESEMLSPSVNLVPAEMKARYKKLPWLKAQFCFAGVPSLCDESLLTMYVLELHQRSKTLLPSSACRNILPSKIIKKIFFAVPQLETIL